jgi:hypothetical protein
MLLNIFYNGYDNKNMTTGGLNSMGNGRISLQVQFLNTVPPAILTRKLSQPRPTWRSSGHHSVLSLHNNDIVKILDKSVH